MCVGGGGGVGAADLEIYIYIVFKKGYRIFKNKCEHYTY